MLPKNNIYHLYHILPGRYDYLTISNNHTSGVYCGDKTGQTVLIAGDHAVITFHSDSYVQERGFLLVFTAVPHGKCNRTTHATHWTAGLCLSSIAVCKREQIYQGITIMPLYLLIYAITNRMILFS